MIWIKMYLKSILKMLFKCIPLKDVIVFESNPDLTDNTLAVFQAMIKHKYNEKYKMVWYLHNEKSFQKISGIKNVRYITDTTSANRIKMIYFFAISRYIITNQSFVSAERRNQISIYLTHGIPLKSVKNYYTLPDYVTYCIATSKDSSKIISEEFNVSESKMVVTGYPRNDILFENKIDFCKLFDGQFKLYVIWYPTYRQHKMKNHSTCKAGIPILHDEHITKKLNDYLVKNEILVIIKPHPSQDVQYIKNYNLSNLLFIDDTFFEINNIMPYNFLASSDALLSDYSSVYYDYLLCDKPIGLIWEDIDEYRKYPGLIKDYEYYTSGAEIIYDYDQLISFFEGLVLKNDGKREARQEIKKAMHISVKADNSERFLKWMVEELNF